MQQIDEAIAAARAAYERGDLDAGKRLGRMYIDLARWDEALDQYEALLAKDPDSLPIRHGHATVLLNIGRADESLAAFDAMIREGNDRPEIRFMRGRSYLELGDVDNGLADLRNSHKRAPSDHSLRNLAGTLWMTGDRDGFDRLLRESARLPALATTTAEILRQSGEPAQALEVLGNARRRAQLSVESWIVAANAYVDLDDGRRAEQASLACLSEDPDNIVVMGSLITALLMQGKAKPALDAARAMRQREPNRQHWIAYEATALRLLGSDEYDKLVDLDRFVRPYKLPVPEGFDSIEDFNAAFLQALDQWQPYVTHPLDQSLRDGSQTPRDLTCIDDPVVRAYVEALDQPIRQYMKDVGDSPDHPLTARNTGNYRITGSWSVRLHGGGWHVNHVHPEGWISSAYYVAVPEETKGDNDKAGWIKFAEPPFATIPPLPPQKWVRPEAGLLVLFPSFMWHGTAPIFDDSERVTAPFDAVPA